MRFLLFASPSSSASIGDRGRTEIQEFLLFRVNIKPGCDSSPSAGEIGRSLAIDDDLLLVMPTGDRDRTEASLEWFVKELFGRSEKNEFRLLALT